MSNEAREITMTVVAEIDLEAIECYVHRLVSSGRMAVFETDEGPMFFLSPLPHGSFIKDIRLEQGASHD